MLLETRSDYTSTFRTLAQHARDPLSTSWPEEWKSWLGIWENRILLQEGAREGTAERMDRKNPVVVPRNHLVEETLEAALEGNLGPFNTLLERVCSPFELSEEDHRFAQPASDEFTATYKTFCGT